MSIVCRLIRHVAAPDKVWNDGYNFSRCSRCGVELVQRSGSKRWTEVPKGFRIVWKARTANDIDWQALEQTGFLNSVEPEPADIPHSRPDRLPSWSALWQSRRSGSREAMAEQAPARHLQA